MALTLPHTLVALTKENVTDVQDNFTTIANSFPLVADSTTRTAVPAIRLGLSGHSPVAVAAGGVVPWGVITTLTPQMTLSSNRIVSTLAGLYCITLQIETTSAVRLRLNGTTYIHSAPSNPSFSTTYRLAVGDYLDVVLTSAASLTVGNSGIGTGFEACWVGF